jgi:diguanylate cyclase (GGDEF)-like protein
MAAGIRQREAHPVLHLIHLLRTTQGRRFAVSSTGSLALVGAILWADPALAGSSLALVSGVLLGGLLLPWGMALLPAGGSRPRRRTGRTKALGAQVESLTKLCAITEFLNSSLDLDELFRDLGRRTATSLDATSCSILLLEESTLTLASSWGPLPWQSAPGAALPADAAAALLARLHDPEPSADLPCPIPAPGSVLTTPMRGRDEVLGLLVVLREEGPAFTSLEHDFLKSVAGQAALAIANARLYAQALELSPTDPLTGLCNRRHLVQRLDLEFALAKRSGQPLTIAVIDVDHFKQINDTAGHAAGDRILQSIAAILLRAVRRTDMVARLGGEEFCMVLPNLPKARALVILEKVRLEVRERGLPEELAHLERVTISLGYSTSGEDGPDLDTLFDAADAALYHSKRTGRDRTTSFVAGMELHPSRERGPAKGKVLRDEPR